MQETTRKTSAERREQIAKTVLRMIGEHGIAAFTTTALAEEIGLTSGALFRHFASRDEILDAAVHYAVHRIDDTFPDDAGAPSDRLLEFARNRVNLLRGEPGIVWLLKSEQARFTLTDGALEHLDNRVMQSRQYVLEALREGAVEGNVRNDVEADILLILFMGAIHTLQGQPGKHQTDTGGKPHRTDRILEALMKVIAPSPSA